MEVPQKTQDGALLGFTIIQQAKQTRARRSKDLL
jgi:hypothetical protein